MPEAFDPDAYLKGPQSPPSGFDPNAYLAGAPTPSPPSPGPLNKALEPITSYPSTYAEMNKDARTQMSTGVSQVTSPESGWDVAKGAGNMALGVLNYVSSPISAALRTVVGKPLEENLGIPKEYSEFAASLALPGTGFTRLATPTKAVASAVPAASDIKSAATAAYNSPEVAALKLHPQIMPAVANVLRDDLATRGFDPLLAPKTFGLIEKAEQSIPEGAQYVTANNFQTLRRMLGKAAESVDPTERAAAKIAQGNIDNIMTKIPPAAVLEGDAQAASSILQDARGNYAAASRTERFQDALSKAEQQAARAGIGGNLENATRQKISSLLNSASKSRGFSDAEKEALQDYVSGDFTRNSLRVATKVLGGDNPLMAAIHAGLAIPTSGWSLAAPLTGYALKKVNNAISASELSKLDEMLRARSPLAESMKNSVTNWASADMQHTVDPTGANMTKLFLATRALSDRLKSGGINADIRQLLAPLQGSAPVGAQEQQQQ